MNMRLKDIYYIPSKVLFILGIVDIIRGFMHTFNINWSAENIAKLDLAAGGDQLLLLGVFGISNFLTGIIFILVSCKAKNLSPHIVAIIPIAYSIGIVGLKVSNITMNSEFNGQYFMLVYVGICILTFIKYIYDKNKKLQ